MYFKGQIYDPLTKELLETNDYLEFIQQIQDKAILDFDEKPPAEEDTYLWVRVVLAESEEELAVKKAPYFRLNKLLCQQPYAERENPDNPGKLFPEKLYEAEHIKHWYPSRHTGSLYVTAISNSSYEKADQFYEFQHKDVDYPRDAQFDCSLLPHDFMNAIDQFQELLYGKDREALINSMQFKKAFVTICLFIAESARFDIIRYAVMNILNLYNETNCTYSLNYTSWAKWRPIIQRWSRLSMQLDNFGIRGFDPELLLGIPVHIIDKRQKSAAFLCTFGFFAEPEQRTQEQALTDFKNNYPFECNLEPGIRLDKNDQLNALFAKNLIYDLSEQAKQHAEQSNYKTALNCYLTAIEHFKENELTDNDLSLTLNYKTALCYFKLNEYESALEYFELSHTLSVSIYGEKDKKTLNVAKFIDACTQNLTQPQFRNLQ